MTQFVSILQNLIPRKSIVQLGEKVGASEAQTELALETINAIMVAFMAQKAAIAQASTSMLKVLDRDKDGNIHDDIADFVQNIAQGEINTNEGKEIVDEIIGEHRHDVIKLVTAVTGMTANAVTTVLIAVAPIIVNKISEEQKKGKWTLKDLGSKLSEATQTSKTEVTQLTLRIFDKNGDGKITDDLYKMAQNIFKKIKI